MLNEEQKARLDRLLSGMSEATPDPEQQMWAAIHANEATVRDLRLHVEEMLGRHLTLIGRLEGRLAALEERVRGLEANSDLVGEAVDELIAEKGGEA